jgi:LCP family protein required for cell wall assembly
MGLDRTVSDQNPNLVYPVSRTDTLIAASFDPVTHRAYLLSIPRDTLADIPEHGTTKINAAYAWGGAPLAIRTVENFLGVRFPYYVAIPERGFVHLIDALGGVSVHIDKDLDYDDNWDGLHIHMKKGYRRLGGKAAMEFARFRHDSRGDLGRIQRQQEVMRALTDELRRPRVVARLSRVFRVLGEDMETNLTRDQLIALAVFGARLSPGGLVRVTLPGTPVGDDVAPDIPRDREVVARIFYNMEVDALARTTVELVADAAPPTPIWDALSRIRALGIRIVGFRTAANPGPAQVIVHRGNTQVAGIVAGLVGGIPVIGGTRGGSADLTIFLVGAAKPAPAGARSR